MLEVLVEMLDICKIDTATTYDEAKKLLETYEYDVAVLDIMGVRGFELLELAKKRGVPALMFTAHALTEDSLKRSAEEGASYFAPKEEVENIRLFIADIIEAKDKKKNPWTRWFDRLGGYFDKKFVGKDWREKEREFWEKRLKQYPGI
jgi:CheY-like chemotaxis protein